MDGDRRDVRWIEGASVPGEVVVQGNPGEKIPAGTRFRLWNAQRY